MQLRFGGLPSQEKEVQEQCRATLTDELRWLESQTDATGPHLLGAQFSLVDAVRSGPLVA